MDFTAFPYEWLIVILLMALFAAFIIRFFVSTPYYVPMEGFDGAARGSGHPDCLRTLPEASALLDKVSKPAVTEGADYRELELLLSKMACLKKDLLSPSGQVDSTRYQAFETAHDRIAVGELCGQCLNQSVSPRDLDISFETWLERGQTLLRRLCTAAHLTEAESTAAENVFKGLYDDVYAVAQSVCLKTDFSKQNGGATGGDVSPYFPENLVNRRTYEYKYGGLSASGANGAV